MKQSLKFISGLLVLAVSVSGLSVHAASAKLGIADLVTNASLVYGTTNSGGVVVRNSGDAAGAAGMVVTFPAEIAIQGASNSGVIDNTAHTITYPNFTVPAGTLTLRTYSFKIADNLTPDRLLNPGFYKITLTDGTGTVIAQPAAEIGYTLNEGLTLSITDALDSVYAGATMTYTINVANHGPFIESGEYIEATIPPNCSLVSATNGGFASQNRVGTPIVAFYGATADRSGLTLAPGQSASVQFTLKLADSLPAGTHSAITVNANIRNGGTRGSELQQVQGSDTDRILGLSAGGYDLGMTLTDGLDSIYANASLLYTATITNRGNETATGVIVQAPVPDNASFVSASNGGAVTGGVVTFPAVDLAAGASITRQFTLQEIAGTQGLTALTVQATATGFVSAFNAQATDVDTITPFTGPDLFARIGVSTGNPVTVGQSIIYDVIFGNFGTADASGVVSSATVPTGTVVDSVSDGATVSNGVIAWPVGTLHTGDIVLHQFTVHVPPNSPHEIDSTAALHDDATHGADLNAANNVASISLTLDSAAFDLSVAIDDGITTLAPGGTATYTITLHNAGPGIAYNVLPVVNIPASTTVVSASDGGGLAAGQTNVVVYPKFDLASGASATRTISVKLADTLPSNYGQNFLVDVTGQVDGNDTNEDNNVASDIDTIVNPTVVPLPSITSEASFSPALAVTGAPVTFTVAATDNGANKTLTYTWDFGDGSTGSGATVDHTYAVAGNYFVSVAVTDEGGEDDSALSIDVVDPGAAFKVTTFKGTFAFKRSGVDTLQYTAELNLPSTFSAAGAQLYLHLVNYDYQPLLNGQGIFRDATHTVSLKKSKTAWVLSLKVSKDYLKSYLAPNAAPSPRSQLFLNQPFTMYIGDTYFANGLDLLYTTNTNAATLTYVDPSRSKKK